jgi:phospholipid/cholesterol/gamma-HCH transport system substrate-binding protein
MKRIVAENWKPVTAILALVVVAGGVCGYILSQQRVRFPWQADTTRMYAELETGQAVTPGQGQQVQVAGVKIGQISAVKLEQGRAVMTLDIEPGNEGLIRSDAKAMLRPRTPLKDMYLQILPGTREAEPAKKGFTIPVRNTTTDVQLEQILASLDRRTRDYVVLLATGAGQGLEGRGGKLAEVFRRFQPTVRDLERVNSAVGREHRALRRLVTSLGELNGELARNPEDLTELVDTSAATFTAFASEDERLRESLSELPPTLRQATTTLRDVRPLARELGPVARALTPAVRALNTANRRLVPFAREAEPTVRREIRPFARAARPLVADLEPAARDLSRTMPELTRGARVLNRFFNMLASNPNGAEGPDVEGREEGYLFWLGWLFHQTVNLQNVEDANGPMRPIFLTGTCGSLTSLVNDNPLMEFSANLSPILAGVCGNPDTASVSLDQLLQTLPPQLRDVLQQIIDANELPSPPAIPGLPKKKAAG